MIGRISRKSRQPPVGRRKAWAGLLLLLSLSAALLVSADGGLDVPRSAVPLSGGPDSFGYRWARNVTCPWIDATTGTPLAWGFPGPVSIGFRFSFYGKEYEHFYIGPGMITFGSLNTVATNSFIPNRAAPNAYIAPFWDDVWTSETSGHLYVKTVGTAPNRRLVVEWFYVGHKSDSRRLMTFELILQETTNDILFNYYSMSAHSRGSGLDATVGIENQDGTAGSGVSANEGWIYDGASVRFYHPGATSRTPCPTTTPIKHWLPIIVKNYSRPVCDPYEPNDRLGQAAGPLVSGAVYYARICSGDPEDLFYIDVVQRSNIHVHLGSIPAGCNYDLFLYDTVANQVAESRTPGSADEDLNHMPATVGRYYIRVFPMSGSSDVQYYSLVVQY